MFYTPSVQKQKQKTTFSQACFFFFLPKVHLLPRRFCCLLPSANSYPISLPLSRANKQSCRPGREGWRSAQRVQLVSVSQQDSRDDRERCWNKGFVWVLILFSPDSEISHWGIQHLQRVCFKNIFAAGSDDILKSTQPFWSWKNVTMRYIEDLIQLEKKNRNNWKYTDFQYCLKVISDFKKLILNYCLSYYPCGHRRWWTANMEKFFKMSLTRFKKQTYETWSCTVEASDPSCPTVFYIHGSVHSCLN